MQAGDKLLVGYGVEIGLKIGVIDRLVSCLEMTSYLFERLVCAPVGSKPVGAILEVSLEDGFQDQKSGLLHHPISYGGDAQGSQLAVGFRDVDPTHRLRFVGVGLDLVTVCTVYTRRASVGFDLLVGC